MRVAHLITSLDVGGAERTLAQLLPAMDRARFASRVFCLSKAGPMAKPLTDAGIQVTFLGLETSRPLTLLRLLPALRQLRAWKPDIVQSWLYHADLAGCLHKMTGGKGALLWNVRCSKMELEHYSGVTRALVRTLAALSGLPKGILHNSHAGKQAHEDFGYRNPRWIYLPNGVDRNLFRRDDRVRTRVRKELGIAEDEICVGVAGRLDPMKGYETLVQAIAKAIHPKLRFVLAGKGITATNPLFQNPSAKRALLLGPRDDLPELFSGMDLFVSSSHFGEGFPNVVAEAMASELPCVATDVGDARILVGDTGRIVAPKDANALAQGISELASLPKEELAALGRQASERIDQEFSFNQMVRRYEEIYEQISQLT